jgi:flagellar protein FliO/FliZ
MKGLSLVTKLKKYKFSLLWTILFLYFYQPAVIYGSANSQFNDGTGYLSTLIKVIAVLFVIIICIIILIKFLASKSNSFMGQRSIRTLSGVQLGQNKSVQLLEIGHNIYIIGVGDNVELIEKIEHSEEIDYIKESLYISNKMINNPKLAFLTEWLNKFKNRSNDRVEQDENDLDNKSFQEIFTNKMNQVSVRNKRLAELLAEEDNTKDRSSDQ